MKNFNYLLALSMMFVGVGCASKQEPVKNDDAVVEQNVVKEENNEEQKSNNIAEFNEFASKNEFYFDFDKSDIKASDKDKPAKFVAKINDLGDGAKLVVSGYCDNKGTAEYNKELGLRRAVAVKNVLEANGVKKDINIELVSYGEQRYTKYVDDVRLNDRKNRKVTIEAK